MSPEGTYVDLRPNGTRDVKVLVDGTWWPGEPLRATATTATGWRGFVRHSTGLGANFVGWHPEERLRPSD